MSQPISFTINIDGGSRGNPGPAAYAYVIQHDGEVVLDGKEYIGTATNNIAEYTALVEALAKAAELKAAKVLIRSDSELLVKQMRGEYKVKNPQLRDLVEEANHLRGRFAEVRFTHVPREQNKEADRLCNEALDEAQRNGQKAPPKRKHNTASTSTVQTPKPSPPSRSDWKIALEEAERLLRDAGRQWSEAGMDSPTPHEVLSRITRLFEESGFLHRT